MLEIRVDVSDVERAVREMRPTPVQTDRAFMRSARRTAAHMRKLVRPRLVKAVGLRRAKPLRRRILVGRRRRGARVWIGLRPVSASELKGAPGPWRRGGAAPVQAGRRFGGKPPAFVGHLHGRRTVLRRTGPARDRIRTARVSIYRKARPAVRFAARRARPFFLARFEHELQVALGWKGRKGRA